MQTLTAAAMREADRRCIEEIGIPSVVLMYNAGKATCAEITGGPVGVVCGKGNNGGDGLVVAHLALLAGLETRVLLLAEEGELTGDPAIYLRVYKQLGGRVDTATEEDAVRRGVEGLADCHTLVDAVFGTGISGEVRGPKRAAIEAWPAVRTVAVDVPSGLDADTGTPCGVAVHAAVTVTFQFAKRGFENPAAADYLGRLVVADIGIPPSCAPAPGEAA
ncbi:MAG: NAD(P)H-hydrate epimerase [Candidatus Hydrogenedentota bacterium]